MSPSCGDCGDEDGDCYMECCGIYLCDDCADKHDDKWGPQDAPIPYELPR